MRKDPSYNINVRNARDKWISYKNRKRSLAVYAAVLLAAALVAAVILLLLGYILVRGVPNLRWSLFSWTYDSENVSMMPAIVNTAEMMALTLLMAVPLGVATAVYLVEYAKPGSRLVKLIRLATETLSGIPSIVYGLFGYLMFVMALGFGYSLIAGALTLTIMVLPLMIRTTEEALLTVPRSYREASYALGAGKLRTVLRVVLPSAVSGVFSGVILAIGRIVGESAALIFTAGTVAEPAGSLTASARTLAVHMYCLLSEGLYIDQAYATAVVLLVIVIGINALSGRAAGKLAERSSARNV
jgi:phosphate transport system permease protein